MTLALGLAGFLEATTGDGTGIPARGPFWSVSTGAGAPYEVRVPCVGLPLSPGETLRLTEDEGPQRELRRIRLSVQRDGPNPMLVVHLRERPQGSDKLMLLPGEPLTAYLTRAIHGRPELLLARAERSRGFEIAEHAEAETPPLDVELLLDDERLVVLLDGQPLLESAAPSPAEGALSVTANHLRLLDLSVEGARPDGGQPFEQHENFDFLEHSRRGGQIAWELAAALAILLAAAAYLRALCLAPPPGRLLCRASLLMAALAAAPFALGLVTTLPFRDLAVGSAMLAVVGCSMALYLLRDYRDGPAENPRRDGLRAAAVVLVLGFAAAITAGTARLAAHTPLLEQARSVFPSLTQESFAHPEALTLDAHNALPVSGSYRSLDLRARVTLAPESILEVRLRSYPNLAKGIALCLSSHPLFDSAFYLENESDFRRLGEASPPCAADAEHDLLIEVRGDHFTAFLDGERVARAESARFPAGAISLLAASGSVSVQSLGVVPTVEPALADARSVVALAAATPLLVLLALVLLARALLGASWLRTLERLAFALIPWAIGFSAAAETGSLGLEAFLWSAAGASLALTLCPVAHPLPGRKLAAAIFAVVTLLAGPATLYATLGAPRAAVGGDGPRYEAGGAQAPVAGLYHFQLPVLRRFNNWLRDHRFRNETPARRKPAGSLRLIALGSSSTWGHGIPESSGMSYPAQLETLLAETADSPPIEVINAAVRGSTSARMLVLMEEVLLRFEPDIVTASFYFNDSVYLTQFDEPAYFAGLPTSSGGALAAFQQQREVQQGKQRLSALYRVYPAASGDTLGAWQRMGQDATDSPVDRFESSIRGLAELCREHDVALVLVKEPLMSGVADIWRKEFGQVMERVGADFGLPVVDPTPALLSAGGDTLYMDFVHPLPTGNRVIAEQLLPVVLETARSLGR